MSRVPASRRACAAAVVLMLAACSSPGSSSEPSIAPSQAGASATPGGSGPFEPGSRERSSAGIVFEAGTLDLPGLASAGQPPPTGPIIQPDASVIGGGPTDAGAETVEEVTSLAFEDVEAFWSSAWMAGYPTIFYESPSGLELYDSSVQELPQSSCAETTDDPAHWANNAFYCYGDRVIAYDVVMANHELQGIGDFAVVGTIAHEWGHHLQNLISTQPSAADAPTFSIEWELQADCFAGMYVAGAGEAGTFPVEVADVAEAAEGFYQSGTSVGYGWFEPGFHGTPEERYDAFMAGYGATQVRDCDAYATYMLESVVLDGPYGVGYLEGASVDFTGEGYLIDGGPYGDVRLVADARTVASATWDGSLLEAVTAYAPDGGGDGPGVQMLGEAHNYSETTQSWGIPGATLGFFYTYDAADGSRHGYMIVHVSPTEHVLILDASLPGVGTAESYAQVEEVAAVAIRSFQGPGL